MLSCSSKPLCRKLNPVKSDCESCILVNKLVAPIDVALDTAVYWLRQGVASCCSTRLVREQKMGQCQAHCAC